MQNPNHVGPEDKFAMNFGNFDAEALFNATHMGGSVNLSCKRSAHDAGLDGELGISSDEDIDFEPHSKNDKMHSSRDNSYQLQNNIDSKNVVLPNGKKTKGRVKIKMEFIDNKLRRYTTFSKRKTGIMKKAYELSTLTGTQVMLLVASETGHVYTFATRKLQPMITSEAGKALIQTCLNSPDPPQPSSSGHQIDQRMSATGYEETELTYAVPDEEHKDVDFPEDYMNGGGSSCSGSDSSSPPTPNLSPAHIPFSPFTNCSSNGGMPLHLGQGLVITPSGTADSIKGDTSSTILENLLPGSPKSVPVDSCPPTTSNSPTNSSRESTTIVELRTVTLSGSPSCHEALGQPGGSVVPGGLMFPSGGSIVYNPSHQEGGTPMMLNLPHGLHLSQELGKNKPLSSLPMNLMSVASGLSISHNQSGTSTSHNQSLPTDLSLHIKREDSSS